MTKIGIIGGSGLDDPDIMSSPVDIEFSTPYGALSSPVKQGKIGNQDVVLLARHGREHTIPPSQVNYRANIYGLKELGCTHIVATTAVGSLRQEIARGDFIVPDQFIDFTRSRKATFHESFEPGKPAHTGMADPFDPALRALAIESARTLGLQVHDSGTIVTIEGPRFSTRAESKMFRLWGADIINMSIAPEAALAREAGIPYVVIAMSTDYDSWKDDEPPVSWKEVYAVFAANVKKMTDLLCAIIPRIR